MPQQTNHKQLKKLALSAKDNINSELHLQRTKQLCYTEKHYFALVLTIALFCTFAEGGGQVVNWFGHWMQKRVEKKHVMYDLVDYGTSLSGLKPKDIQKHKKEYYKYCQLPRELKSPMVVVMFGNKVAQILWKEQPFAFVLESKEIKESFMKYFHYFWKEPR